MAASLVNIKLHGNLPRKITVVAARRKVKRFTWKAELFEKSQNALSRNSVVGIKQT